MFKRHETEIVFFFCILSRETLDWYDGWEVCAS